MKTFFEEEVNLRNSLIISSAQAECYIGKRGNNLFIYQMVGRL